MESSRFFQLTSDILVEYVYADQSNPTTFNTADYPIEIMRDLHTNGSYFFNTDTVAATMGNYRDISAVSINAARTEYVSLNTSVGVPYNDVDPKLTNSNQLPQTFSPDLDIVYDRVRIHFASGFNFDNYDGIVFEILANRRDQVVINLASINFYRTDTPGFNPDPFLLTGKLYTTFIEFRVPALFNMINNFTSNNPNLLGYKLTEGKGFDRTSPLTIRAAGINTTTKDNSFDFYEMRELNAYSFLNRDVYDNLSASVVESSAGDYFELTGLVTNSSLSNFIAQLNSTGGDYITIHEIEVSEQIGTSFVKTSAQMFTQLSDFDDPQLFRPIILNSAIAVSFAINYTLRLFNRADSTQIIKKARLTSFDPKKYGRRLNKINLGTVPTVAKVYNQIEPDNGRQIVLNDGSSSAGLTSDVFAGNVVIRNRYVTTVRDRLNVVASIAPTQVETISEEDPGVVQNSLSETNTNNTTT